MLKKLIILGLIVVAVGFKLFMYERNYNFDGNHDYHANDFGQFRMESAIRYHYANLVAEGKAVPEIDQNAQYPEGLRVKERIKLTTEYTAGIIYRFIPNSIPFNVFLIWFMFIISSLSVAAVFLVTEKITDNIWASLVSALFYLAAFPSYARTVAGGFVEEDFALPFIFFGLYFFMKAMERGQKKILYSLLAGFLLFIPVTSWHLTQFFLLLLIAFMIYEFFLRFSERDQLMLPFLCVIGFNALGGLIVPTLRAENFIFSFGMLVSYALLAAWGASKTKMLNRWMAMVFFAAMSAALIGWAVSSAGAHASEYGHVYSLIKYKVLYLGSKPGDPSSMPFDAKVFWQAGFLSPTGNSLLTGFSALLAASLFGIWVFLRKFFKGFTLPYEDILLFFMIAFIPIYLLFDRLNVFLVFFMAPFAGVIISGGYEWLKKDAVKVTISAALTVLFITAVWLGLLYDSKQRDIDVHNDAVQWIKSNTKESEPVLANFGLAGAIFHYGQRPVVLHPMFEAADIRKKTKEFYESLFSGEKEFYNYCVKNGARTFVYNWHFIFDKSNNSVRYQINNGAMAKDCAAMILHFYPEKTKNFTLLYQNTYYRIYHVNYPDEFPSTQREVKYLPFFNPRIFVAGEGPTFNDAFAQEKMKYVWALPNMQSHAGKLAADGDFAGAEKLFKEIVSVDPYFPDSRMGLIDFYVKTNSLPKAVLETKEALRYCPGNPMLLQALGVLEAENKRK